MQLRKFKHARFTARFPEGYRYARSHYWLAAVDGDLWRVGFTKFATRMLGELVEAEWKRVDGDIIAPGDQIGWVEGFKAASDVFCVMEGSFVRGNPALDEDACIIRSSPYVDGWLYEARGEPEGESMDLDGYLALLDATITKMQESGAYD